jgi:hypothetical protein
LALREKKKSEDSPQGTCAGKSGSHIERTLHLASCQSALNVIAYLYSGTAGILLPPTFLGLTVRLVFFGGTGVA